MMPPIGNGNPQENARENTSVEAGIVSLLSLKLLLLAFFILLNSLSELEALKVRNVEHNMAMRGAADGPLDGTRLLLADLGQLFADMLPAVYVESAEKSELMALEVQVGTFFTDGEARLQAGRGLLLDRLAARLREWEADGISYSLALLTGRRADDGGKDAIQVSRVAVLAQRLAAQGVPMSRLAIGFRETDAEKLRLEFSLQRPAGGSVDESELRP
jgi:hypothetical protein